MTGVGIPRELPKASDMIASSSFLGTDVGGTFTDLALITSSGELHCFKVPSTPSRPGASILSGVDEIQASLEDDQSTWQRIIHTHSSTVATNALIERKGSRIGLFVSAGFRDLFELQRLAVPPRCASTPGGHDLWCRAPWCAKSSGRLRRRRAGGRASSTGTAVRRRANSGAGGEIAVVVLLHSYRNPAHEFAPREIRRSQRRHRRARALARCVAAGARIRARRADSHQRQHSPARRRLCGSARRRYYGPRITDARAYRALQWWRGTCDQPAWPSRCRSALGASSRCQRGSRGGTRCGVGGG